MFLPNGSPFAERTEDNLAAGVDTPSCTIQEQEGQEEDCEDVRCGDHHLHRVLGPLPCLLHPGVSCANHHKVSTDRYSFPYFLLLFWELQANLQFSICTKKTFISLFSLLRPCVPVFLLASYVQLLC